MSGRQLTIAGFVALISAIAANGRAAIDAFGAALEFLMKLATALPLGVWSVLLSLTITTLAWAHLDRAAHLGPREKQPGHALSAESIALLLGVSITLAQTLVGWPKSAQQMLFALLLGILVGLAAPYIGKIIAALVRKVIA